MEKVKFESIRIKVYGLEHTNGDYNEIATGTIGELFFNTYRLRNKGLFHFENFGYETVENEIEILKDDYESENEQQVLNNEYFIKEFEKVRDIKINFIEDILVYGISHNGNGWYMNLSSCNSDSECFDKLSDLVANVYGNFPSPKGVQREIIIKID